MIKLLIQIDSPGFDPQDAQDTAVKLLRQAGWNVVDAEILDDRPVPGASHASGLSGFMCGKNGCTHGPIDPTLVNHTHTPKDPVD